MDLRFLSILFHPTTNVINLYSNLSKHRSSTMIIFMILSSSEKSRCKRKSRRKIHTSGKFQYKHSVVCILSEIVFFRAQFGLTGGFWTSQTSFTGISQFPQTSDPAFIDWSDAQLFAKWTTIPANQGDFFIIQNYQMLHSSLGQLGFVSHVFQVKTMVLHSISRSTLHSMRFRPITTQL